MALITLTTDFGTADTYSAVMKGVILSINPDCRIVDITHQIDPYNIRSAGFTLMTAFSYFPKNTIHVAVVDPGVGTDRRALVIDAGDHVFVGPDNGIFSFILSEKFPGKPEIHEITDTAYMLPQVSSTFQGRDIFAPAAAHLSLGVPARCFGAPVQAPVSFPFPEPVLKSDTSIEGEALHIDRFGNIISNIPRLLIDTTLSAPFYAQINETTVSKTVPSYGFASEDEIFCLFGSSGFLEISLKNKSAAEKIGCCTGDKIIIRTNQNIH